MFSIDIENFDGMTRSIFMLFSPVFGILVEEGHC